MRKSNNPITTLSCEWPRLTIVTEGFTAIIIQECTYPRCTAACGSARVLPLPAVRKTTA